MTGKYLGCFHIKDLVRPGESHSATTLIYSKVYSIQVPCGVRLRIEPLHFFLVDVVKAD